MRCIYPFCGHTYTCTCTNTYTIIYTYTYTYPSVPTDAAPVRFLSDYIPLVEHEDMDMNHLGTSCVICQVSCVMCHVSCVMCHVSCVMCHVSCVICPDRVPLTRLRHVSNTPSIPLQHPSNTST